MPVIGPLEASAVVANTVDIASLISEAGGDPAKARYDNSTGVLHIVGITQDALDAVLGQADPLFGHRFLLKQEAIKELNARTDAGMPWLGKVVQIDETSTGRMTAVAFGMQLGAASSVSWRMADNTPSVLDKPGMLAMAVAAMGYVLSLRHRYWEIVDGAKAAADSEALDAIDPQAGWPAAPAAPGT